MANKATKGTAKRVYFGAELAEAGSACWEFVNGVIERHQLKREEGYHIESRCISLADVDINEDTKGHFSDDQILQILDKYSNIVAFAYTRRDDMNCAEVVMVDMLD